MGRHERHAVARVVHHGSAFSGGTEVVVRKLGLRVAVGGSELQAVLKEERTHRGFHTTTAAAAGIDHHAAHTARGEAGQLLVARLHVERGEVELEGLAEQVEVRAELVAPGVLGLIVKRLEVGNGRRVAVEHGVHALDGPLLLVGGKVGDAVDGFYREVLHGQHHHAAEHRLAEVGIALDVVATRTVALGHAEVDITQIAGQRIAQGSLGKYLPAVVRERTAERRVGGEVGVERHRRSHAHAEMVRDGRCRSRSQVEPAVVVVETQAQGERQTGQQQVFDRQKALPEVQEADNLNHAYQEPQVHYTENGLHKNILRADTGQPKEYIAGHSPKKIHPANPQEEFLSNPACQVKILLAVGEEKA